MKRYEPEFELIDLKVMEKRIAHLTFLLEEAICPDQVYEILQEREHLTMMVTATKIADRNRNRTGGRKVLCACGCGGRTWVSSE